VIGETMNTPPLSLVPGWTCSRPRPPAAPQVTSIAQRVSALPRCA
jgi:hypothetical protein